MKRIIMIIIAIALTGMGASPIYANSWSIQTVSTGSNGGHSYTFVGSTPHIAYYKLVSGCTMRVMHSYKTGLSWSSEIVDTITDCNLGNQIAEGSSRTDIEADQSGNLYLAYGKNSDGTAGDELHYAYKAVGGSWSIVNSFSGNTYNNIAYLNLEVDLTATTAVFAFQDSQGSDKYVRYLYNSGGSWVSQDIDSANSTFSTGEFLSLDLDSNNSPHVGYYAGSSTNPYYLKYGTKVSSTWQLATVDSDPDLNPIELQLTVDGKDVPNIGYAHLDTECNLLKLATEDQYGSWNTSTVSCTTLSNVSLGFMSTDNSPIFGYGNWTGSDTRPYFGYYASGVFTAENVSTSMGNRAMVEVNSSTGLYHMVYAQGGSYGVMGQLKFATRN